MEGFCEWPSCLTWKLHHSFFIPSLLDHGTVMRLISKLESAHICRGYPRKEFVDMANARGGVIRRVNGEARAHVDSLHPVAMNGEIYQSNLRTTDNPVCFDLP